MSEDKRKPKRTGFCEDEPKIRVQISMEKRQVDWCKKRKKSPSQLLREHIEFLMTREKEMVKEFR
jgi:hypothetical protein